MRLKTCKNKECKKKFKPEREFQTTCDFNCAIAYANQQKQKREENKKKDNRKRLREFKKNDKPLIKQLAQKTFNTYIRVRDKNELCISCGHNFNNGRQIHAGHYISVGQSSFLRFNEDNVHAQCSICNNHLSGNVEQYRVRLIQKIGSERLEFLENNRTTLKNYTIEELHEIIKEYKLKIKNLQI